MPDRPDIPDCDRCNGDGRLAPENSVDGPVAVICPECGGTGKQKPSSPDIPEEAVQNVLSKAAGLGRAMPRAWAVKIVEAAAPALRKQGAEEERQRIKRRFGEDSRIARWVREKLDDICEEGR